MCALTPGTQHRGRVGVGLCNQTLDELVAAVREEPHLHLVLFPVPHAHEGANLDQSCHQLVCVSASVTSPQHPIHERSARARCTFFFVLASISTTTLLQGPLSGHRVRRRGAEP